MGSVAILHAVHLYAGGRLAYCPTCLSAAWRIRDGQETVMCGGQQQALGTAARMIVLQWAMEGIDLSEVLFVEESDWVRFTIGPCTHNIRAEGMEGRRRIL